MIHYKYSFPSLNSIFSPLISSWPSISLNFKRIALPYFRTPFQQSFAYHRPCLNKFQIFKMYTISPSGRIALGPLGCNSTVGLSGVFRPQGMPTHIIESRNLGREVIRGAQALMPLRSMPQGLISLRRIIPEILFNSDVGDERRYIYTCDNLYQTICRRR